jgi:hypothetical protein
MPAFPGESRNRRDCRVRLGDHPVPGETLPPGVPPYRRGRLSTQNGRSVARRTREAFSGISGSSGSEARSLTVGSPPKLVLATARTAVPELAKRVEVWRLRYETG